MKQSYVQRPYVPTFILNLYTCFILQWCIDFPPGLSATVVELSNSNQYVVDLVQSNSASKDRNIATELISAKMVRPTNR